MTRVRLFLLVALALAAAIVAAGCGGGKETVPIDTVAEAAEATNNAGGFKVEISP